MKLLSHILHCPLSVINTLVILIIELLQICVCCGYAEYVFIITVNTKSSAIVEQCCQNPIFL